MSKLSLAEKAGFIGIGRFLRTLSKLLFALILVRLLSKYDFGTYRQIFLLYNLFSVIFFLGIPTSIYYFFPQFDTETSKKFIIQSELALFFLGILLGAIFLATSGLIGRHFSNPSIPEYMKWFAFYPMLDFPVQVLSPLLICYDKHKLSAVANIVFVFTFLLSLLVPIVLGRPLIDSFISLILVSSIQLLIVGVIIFKLVGGFRVWLDFNLLISQLKYSVPLGLSSFATVISRELDKLVIGFFFLPQVFAVYVIGARELPFVTIIPYAVSSTLFPKFVTMYKEKRNTELINLWHKATIKSSLILLPMSVAFFISADEIIEILYTSSYLECVPVFRYYLFLMLIHVTAFDSLVLSLGLPKLVLYGSVAGILLNVILNVLMIKLFGFAGPAIATVVVSYMITYYLLRIIKKKTGTRWSKVFPWKKYLLILVVSILSGLLVLPVQMLAIPVIFKFLLLCISYSIVYFLIAKKCHLLSKEDEKFIKNWVTFKVFYKQT